MKNINEVTNFLKANYESVKLVSANENRTQLWFEVKADGHTYESYWSTYKGEYCEGVGRFIK